MTRSVDVRGIRAWLVLETPRSALRASCQGSGRQRGVRGRAVIGNRVGDPALEASHGFQRLLAPRLTCGPGCAVGINPALCQSRRQRLEGETPTMASTPVVFIHGLWLHARSWNTWIERLRQAGYTSLALGRPREADSVAEAPRARSSSRTSESTTPPAIRLRSTTCGGTCAPSPPRSAPNGTSAPRGSARPGTPATCRRCRGGARGVPNESPPLAGRPRHDRAHRPFIGHPLVEAGPTARRHQPGSARGHEADLARPPRGSAAAGPARPPPPGRRRPAAGEVRGCAGKPRSPERLHG